MKKILFIFIVPFFVTCSINNKQNIHKTGDIYLVESEKEIKIDTKVSLIALETNKSCLLDNINNIQVSNKYIYVLDNLTVYRYSKEGKYINKIKNGNGPGEILHPLNIIYDNNLKLVYLIEKGNILSIYNEQLDYIGTNIIDGSFTSLIPIDNENIILYSNSPARWSKFAISYFDLYKKEVYAQDLLTEEFFSPDLNIIIYNNFFKFNNEIYFIASNSRNIYKYKNGKFIIEHTIKSNDFDPPNDFIKRFSYRNVRKYRKLCNMNGYLSFINFSQKLNNYLLIGFDMNKYTCGVKSLEDSLMYLTTYTSLFELPKTSSFTRPVFSDENNIYFLYTDSLNVNSILTIHNQSLKIAKNSNPVIVKLEFNK